MPPKLLFFLSEILSAKSIYPILIQLMKDCRYEITIVNDGFSSDFIKSLGLPYISIERQFQATITAYIQWADVIVTGKTYVQQSEYHICEQAHDLGKPVLLILPDMGSDIARAKLRGLGGTFGEGAPLPTLLLADNRTRDALAAHGIPADKMVDLGNPYFDQLYQALSNNLPTEPTEGIGYFSTPFELDYTRGILPAAYRQRDYIKEIERACHIVGQSLIAKRHHQLEPRLFKGITVFDGAPLNMLRRVRVAVGSYSSTLLEAYVTGVPTISYQPWGASIREDVFRDRIEIVKTFDDLVNALQNAITSQHTRAPMNRTITYHPLKSVERFMEILASTAYETT